MDIPVYRKGEAPVRAYCIERKTKETCVSVDLCLDGGTVSVSTGIGFFDHMLTALAFYAGWGLTLSAQGDLHVDGHHTVEDVGIVLGQAMRGALGERTGIRRFGCTYVPMDEALCRTVVDISNRPFLVFRAEMPQAVVGSYDACLTEEFMRAVAVNAGLTLHQECLYGGNSHHITEALFKSLGLALKDACRADSQGVTSTKGVL